MPTPHHNSSAATWRAANDTPDRRALALATRGRKRFAALGHCVDQLMERYQLLNSHFKSCIEFPRSNGIELSRRLWAPARCRIIPSHARWPLRLLALGLAAPFAVIAQASGYSDSRRPDRRRAGVDARVLDASPRGGASLVNRQSWRRFVDRVG